MYISFIKKKLYTSDPTIQFTFLNRHDIRIDEDIKESMEGAISMKELKTALGGMARNKASGCDGLSMETYVVFFSKTGTILLNAINYAYENGKLHNSALRGIICLIPKRGKDSRILTNLRPITLLNTDYKLIEKVLANRLKPALEQIINEDQKAYLPRRHIHTNIRRILDLLYYAERENREGVILSLDFSKCFDRIPTESLLAALEYFNVGPSFVKWTKIIYKDTTSAVLNNGNLSRWFKVTQSVKQGGPCSAYYFLVVAEILALELRSSDVKGVFLEDLQKILGQFAGDLDMYLEGKEDNIQKAIDIIKFFGQNTGFKINYDKTTLYRLGSLRKAEAKRYTTYEIKVVEKCIEVLGVTIAYNNDICKMNYDPIVSKLTSILAGWRNRGLSLVGKVLVVNTLVMSLFTYKMGVLPLLSKAYIKKVESIVSEFLWNSRKPKISLETLKLSKNDGGMGLIDLHLKDKSLKFSWVQTINEDSFVARLAYDALKIDLGAEIWQCNLKSDDVCMLFGHCEFWRDVLYVWAEINYSEPEDQNEILNQILWYNSNIRIADKPIYYKK